MEHMGHVNWTVVLQTAITILGFIFGSVGLWNYLDHRQQRKTDKEMQDSELLKEVKGIRTEIADFRKDTQDEISKLKETIDENEAKASRIRILKFADEIFMNARHSKDSFDQCMGDITFYEKYCTDHPKFKNHQTAETVSYLKEVYHERMQKKDFAKYGRQDKEE